MWLCFGCGCCGCIKIWIKPLSVEVTVRLSIERRHFPNSGNSTNRRCPGMMKKMSEGDDDKDDDIYGDDGVYGDDDDGEKDDSC